MFLLSVQEPETPPPPKEVKSAKQSKSAAKKAAKLAAQAGALYRIQNIFTSCMSICHQQGCQPRFPCLCISSAGKLRIRAGVPVVTPPG